MADTASRSDGVAFAGEGPGEVWINANLASFDRSRGVADWAGIKDGVIAVTGGSIQWCGPRNELPADYKAWPQHDLGGAWVTPGLIDCHTHLVYAGDRSDEFEARLQGSSYQAIARSGGGIQSTVRATRTATPEELFAQSSRRLRHLMSEGLTTIEIKSGYGLDLQNEQKILRVARELGRLHDVGVRTTFLAAHALPTEYADRPDAYIEEVCEHMLPAIVAEGLADAVDAFCEGIGFTHAQTSRMFEAARRFNLPVKLHADQLSDTSGAALASRFGALSADHLEYTSHASVAAMATSGTVAVLLPGAYYFLNETQRPPIAQLREQSVPIAISTDCNPGTSPCTSLLLMLNMACTLFGLTPLEALSGVTVHAARALGLRDRGILAAGLRADFAVWDVRNPVELAYCFGSNPCIARVVAGRTVS